MGCRSFISWVVSEEMVIVPGCTDIGHTQEHARLWTHELGTVVYNAYKPGFSTRVCKLLVRRTMSLYLFCKLLCITLI